MISRSAGVEEGPLPKQQSSVRDYTLLLLGFIPALIVHLANIQLITRFGILARPSRLERWMPTIFVAALCETAILFFTLPTKNSSRRARISRVVLTVLSSGILVSAGLFWLLMYLYPYNPVQERLLLSLLIFTISIILAAIALFLPTWNLHIPENEIWMLLDRHNDLLTYLPPGKTWVRPINGVEPYIQAGPFIIEVDESNLTSQDGFPFRVRAYIPCLFTPLNAAPARYAELRSMQREQIAARMKDDILFIIRQTISNFTSEELRERYKREVAMHNLIRDITACIAKREDRGIRLLSRDSVMIDIDMPEIVANAVTRNTAIHELLHEVDPDHMIIRIDESGNIYVEQRAPSGVLDELLKQIGKLFS